MADQIVSGPVVSPACGALCRPAARAWSKYGLNCGRGTPISGPPSPNPTRASGWRAYRGITLPLLRPALLVAAVLNLIYVFNSFPIVWTLNDRNPGFAHDTMITYMYKIAFKSALRDVGLAAALGVVNVALILIAVLAYLKVAWVREEPA